MLDFQRLFCIWKNKSKGIACKICPRRYQVENNVIHSDQCGIKFH